MRDPVFVSGLRKSGTSLVKCLLDGHPELFVYPPNELHFFRYSDHDAAVKDKRDSIGEPTALLETLAGTDFVDFVDDPDHKYEGQGLDVEAFRAGVAERSPESYADVYEALFEEMEAAASHTDADLDEVRPVSKSVLETEFTPELLEWFPDAKFVCVLRNPYGHFVAARNAIIDDDGGLRADSLSESLRTPYPFVGSELWRMKLSYYFMRKYESLYPDNFHVLVFDDLLRDPETTLHELAEFVGVDYDPVMGTPTICDVPWGGNSWKDDEFEGISTDPLDHWKGDITAFETRVVNDLFGDVLDEYGFETLPSNVSPLRPYHVSERPHTYVANRVAYLWQRVGNVGSASESFGLRDLLGGVAE